MVFKFIVLCASALLLQTACGQVVNRNSLVDNNIYISGNGLSSGGLVGTGFLNTGAFSSGINNVGSVSSGIVESGLGSGVISTGNLGSGIISTGNLGSGIISTGNLNSGIISTGNLGSGIISTGNLGSGIVSNGLGSSYVAGGPIAVTSISPIGPSGLAVASENVLEGILTVSGQLPFLSAVAFEGGLPTAGSGVATCGCGNNGDVSIVSEGIPQGFRY